MVSTTEMNQQDSQPGEQSQPKPGPGAQLQTARISMGMTLEEVASKMHLPIGILSSLEENNFEDITAPIFVKGYLRAYSRLVHINEDDVIQQYSTYYMDGDPPISSTSNTSPEINADDSKVRKVTYLVILGLLVLLSVWWWNRYQQSPETVSLESENKSQSAVIALDDAHANEAASSDINANNESLQLGIKTVVDSLEIEAKQQEEVQVISTELENLAGSIANKIEPEMAVADSTNNEEAIIDEVVMDDIKPTIQPSLQDDKKLVITVNADTWASIKDNNGKKLVYDLLHAGEKISVTGKTPISVFLGNGYGVSMRYKGKDIDLSSSIRADNTARIKIGQ